MTNEDATRRWTDTVLIAAFLAAIAAPAAAMLAAPGGSTQPLLGETRTPFPSIGSDAHSMRMFPVAAQQWFNSNFGLRTTLVRSMARWKLRVFGLPANRSVILGTDDWLYYGGEHELECMRNAVPLTPDELAAWRGLLESRRDWLAERGIPYVFVVAPDKHSVQGEHLPSWIRAASPVSRLDQLVQYMRERSTVEVLDVRADLREAARERDVYLRHDTHWNELGAFLAYETLLAAARRSLPALRVVTLSDFSMVTESSHGDLGYVLGLPDEFRQESVSLVPRRPRRARYTEGATGPVVGSGDLFERRASACPGAEIPSAVVFHDSFGVGFIPLLAEHFERAVFARTKGGFDRELVERERPAIVIDEFVERMLMLDVEKLARLQR
jgi:hypothetical protein